MAERGGTKARVLVSTDTRNMILADRSATQVTGNQEREPAGHSLFNGCTLVTKNEANSICEIFVESEIPVWVFAGG